MKRLGRRSLVRRWKRKEERETYKQYVSIRDRIQERYEETMDNPRHFEKVRWFAEYWNNAIPVKHHLRVLGAGLHPHPNG
jgi:hypothetical protein